MDCRPPGSSVHGDSPGQNTGEGSHALLQGIFLTQESNRGLLYCRWILYQLSYQGSSAIWNAYILSHLDLSLMSLSPSRFITEHQAELPVLYSNFPLAVYFIPGSVYMSRLISQFIPPSPSPHPMSTYPFLCLHLYSCPANGFTCTIFLDSIGLLLLLLLSHFSPVRLCATP